MNSSLPISRRRAAASILALAGLPGLALAQTATIALPAADRALVKKAADYLQGLTQAKARFRQVSARGTVTTGDLYLHRPGKARFAYDPPSGLLVVSDGRNVSVYDNRLKTFDSYPLGATPLALFLARRVSFEQDVVVSRVDRFADGFSLVVRSPQGRNEGHLVLTFNDDPVYLRQWRVVEPQGQATEVVLSDLEATSGLDPALFVLRDPRPRSG